MIKSILQFIRNLFISRAQLQIENIYLRKQLEIVTRSSQRIKVKKLDKVFLILGSKFLRSWKDHLVIVKPETLIRWHRERFKLFWKKKSRRRVEVETRKLINQLAQENITWGAS